MRRFKAWLLRLPPEELWWTHHLPDARRFRFDSAAALVKDEDYWRAIVAILENGSFLQEMAELEARYRKAIDSYLLKDEWKLAREARLRLQGMKRVLIILTDANKILLKTGGLDGLED